MDDRPLGGRALQSPKSSLQLRAIGLQSVSVAIDVTDRDGLEPAFNTVERELGIVGILVNNAGNLSQSGGVLQENLRIGTT